MSKKKADFYLLSQLAFNRPHATLIFYDHKGRRLLSSVDVVINMDYYTPEEIGAFVAAR